MSIKRVTVERFAYTFRGVFGELVTDNFRCFTVERPWMNNRPNISCIPTDVYALVRGRFRDHYENFEVRDVPGRTYIELHRGNTMLDIKGCIALGLTFQIDGVNDVYKINHSRHAFDAFMQAMGTATDAVLVVKNRVDRYTKS